MNLHCNLLTCHCANIYAPPAEGAHLAEYGDYISLGIDLAEHYANAGGAR